MLGYFPGGPVVKNLPCNAGDAGSIPGQGTKIPRARWPIFFFFLKHKSTEYGVKEG